MMYPDWHKKQLEMRATMHIRHYRLRAAGDIMGIAGCGCRGCNVWRAKMAKARAEWATEMRADWAVAESTEAKRMAA